MTPVYVYVLEGERGCKIGVSENPRQRARNIATQGGFSTLRLCIALPVLANIGREVEREAHRLLAAYRSIGEWFSIDNLAATKAVEAAIITVTKRYTLTDLGGNLLPPLVEQKRSTISVPDVIDRFIADRIDLRDGAHIRARELYRAFVDWCVLTGEEQISETAFGRAMSHRLKKDRLSRIRRYLNVEIREAEPP